jgi:hypothetical protein
MNGPEILGSSTGFGCNEPSWKSVLARWSQSSVTMHMRL